MFPDFPFVLNRPEGDVLVVGEHGVDLLLQGGQLGVAERHLVRAVLDHVLAQSPVDVGVVLVGVDGYSVSLDQFATSMIFGLISIDIENALPGGPQLRSSCRTPQTL